MSLVLKNLNIGYNEKPLLSNIDAITGESGLICLLGRNGKGKSTLLKSIAHLVEPLQGSVLFNEQDLRKKSPQERAHLVSIMLTDKISTDGSVKSLVSLGRNPYTSWFGNLNKVDHQIIERSSEIAGIEHLLNKNFNELSDGERQRVMLARTLAQDTPLLLLDEPTAFLDLPGRIEIFQNLVHFSRSQKKILVVSTHEIELALQLSEHIWYLDNQFYQFSTHEFVSSGIIEQSFLPQGVSFNTNSRRFELPAIH